jgi:hypothetical protein
VQTLNWLVLVLGALFTAGTLFALGSLGYRAHLAPPFAPDGGAGTGTGWATGVFCNQCGRLSEGRTRRCPACGATLDPAAGSDFPGRA